MSTNLIAPHGGELCNLVVDSARAAELKEASRDFPSWDLTGRQVCDLELILNGGFSPLRGFMTEAQYNAVCDDMRLPDGNIFTMPITLDVSDEFGASLSAGDKVALRDMEGVIIAILTVEDVYSPDKAAEATKVFGTTNEEHPAVNYLMKTAGSTYVGGSLEGLTLPTHYDYGDERKSPSDLRAAFEAAGSPNVVAFQTRNPMHRAHQELTLRAAAGIDGKLLIHPVVGMTKPGDVDHYTRVRCYRELLKTYPEGKAEMALLPLAMRMGGPREAVWHAIIRKNFGCSHIIVGRDHAGPGSDSDGNPFYGPYDAQELLKGFEEELGIEMVPFKLMVYVEETGEYQPLDELPEGTKTLNISGTELRRRLATGEDIPDWFTYPAIVAELRKTHPPRDKKGFTVFFTGLSGSGKSTIANALLVKMLESDARPVTLLDGDIVRKNLSSELGFSKEHRDLNVSRIGFVASEVTKHRGIAICAPIAPYADIRAKNRALIESYGGYVLVHVATSLEECEKRDTKGLYAKARAGIIKEFTGISDPYDVPEDAELSIDTVGITPQQAADQVMDYLKAEGYLS